MVINFRHVTEGDYADDDDEYGALACEPVVYPSKLALSFPNIFT